jgi:cobalt-zinc-cadmium efflux system outer membrane protein
MSHLKTTAVVIALLTGVMGCASLQNTEEWENIKEKAELQIGHEIMWQKTEEDKQIISEKVDDLLSDGLTREEAVQVALFNNQGLQATFEELGISRADLVQAGYFHNPKVGSFIRFPEGDEAAIIESELFFRISDLWQIPLQKKVADSQMNSTLMQVGQIVLDTSSTIKMAYDRAIYLESARKETENLLKKFKEISKQVRKRREFGYMSDFDIYQSDVMIAQTEMDLAEINSELNMAKSQLNKVMGVDQFAPSYILSEKNSVVREEIPSYEEAVKYALENRFDVQMARFEISEANHMIKLAKAGAFNDVNIGISYERESDRTNSFGPGIEMELPVFDQNRAKVTAARHRLQQAEKNLLSLEGTVKMEIKNDLDLIRLYKTKTTLFEGQIIPLWENAMEYAQKWADAMQLNRLYLLESQKELLKSRRDYLEAQLELSHAYIEFERDLGGNIP